MNNETCLIPGKISEITEELKQLGLWKRVIPAWVLSYHEKSITSEQDFLEWLQFIFLPNLQHTMPSGMYRKEYIVPQAIRFFGDDVKKGRLLQLLIELDSLS